MNVIAQTRVPAHQNMEHARSPQRDRVSRETGSRPYPLANSACLSHVRWHTPFSHSLSHRVPLRDPGARQKRGSASGLPSAAMRRAARLLQGDAGESTSDEQGTNRLSSSAWGNANGEVNAETHEIHSATHNRLPILRPFVSRETCCWLRPNSIPAQTGVSFMAGEGPGAN